ncbi:hypothetical protein AB0I60_24275 [Actinosynnema sp. NPDC050436]|uniref:hypothetical protein n=1 Tax=Actinosynnema sp. NPDC050436 TaxID=3155659 RepID=UPI0033EEAE19
MFVLEVANDELMESLTRQAKERGIINAAIVSLIGVAGHLHHARIGTWFARAHVINLD